MGLTDALSACRADTLALADVLAHALVLRHGVRSGLSLGFRRRLADAVVDAAAHAHTAGGADGMAHAGALRHTLCQRVRQGVRDAVAQALRRTDIEAFAVADSLVDSLVLANAGVNAEILADTVRLVL